MAHLAGHRPILAVGADLKNAIALAVDGEVIVSQHIGDLGEMETDRAFERTVRDLLKMYDLRPQDLIVAHDLHPEYFSTRFAQSLDCHRQVEVQHHRAHIASVMAERGEVDRPVVGIALDGTGWGDDRSIWGFEIFVGGVTKGLRRVTHLPQVSMPGGDAAARHPVQAAAGFLATHQLPDMRQPPFRFPDRFYQAQQLVAKNVRCIPSSSAGRLFDTVAALCGFTREISFEGQAAIWLENLASSATPSAAYSFTDLDHRPLLASIVADRLAGRDVCEIAFAFHAAVARSIWNIARSIASTESLSDCALSGGTFQNRLVRELLHECADEHPTLKLHFNETVPTNDGGISLGQAAFAHPPVDGLAMRAYKLPPPT